MNLSRRNWLVRYAYSLSGRYAIPSHTTLCALFWRVVGITCTYALFGTIPVGLCVMIYQEPWEFLGAFALVIGSLVTLFLIGTVKDAATKGELPPVIGAAYDGFKNRFCPVIHLVSEDDK